MAAGQMEMPDEIFIKIFSYLQIHDLFRIGGTCKQWRRLSIDSLRQIAKREYNNLMWMEENQNYPIEELIRLVDILVKCGDIYRETLTSKAAGIAQAMENSLPSLDKIAAAAVLANLGYMPTLQFERLFIEDIDLTIVPRCNLASLAACFSIDEIHINNVHSDLTDLLRHLQCQRLFLDNLSLSERATEALVAAMETGVEEVTFDDGWSNIGRRPDYDMTLSMSALSQYSGTDQFVEYCVIMKPIMMHGHERSITQIKYNREGDLLFSSAKDHHPNVWYSLNGERLGTYDGHCGAVWCLDPKWDTSHLVTGAADNTVRLWDIQTGKELNKIDTKSAVRTTNFSFSGNMICYTTDKQMGYPCEIVVVDARTFNPEEPIFKVAIPPNGPKVTSMLWGGLDELLLTGHDNGDLVQWDVKTQKKLKLKSDHGKTIMDMQPSKDGSMFITASKDHTSMLFDADTMDRVKTYTTERPVNSASLSPLYDHVVLGGGQDAMDVTTTSTKVGKFESRFFHTIFEEEFGRVKGHFGPINSVQFHPDGRGYASGGEDGYVRVHQFDEAYFEFKFDF